MHLQEYPVKTIEKPSTTENWFSVDKNILAHAIISFCIEVHDTQVESFSSHVHLRDDAGAHFTARRRFWGSSDLKQGHQLLWYISVHCSIPALLPACLCRKDLGKSGGFSRRSSPEEQILNMKFLVSIILPLHRQKLIKSSGIRENPLCQFFCNFFFHKH